MTQIWKLYKAEKFKRIFGCEKMTEKFTLRVTMAIQGTCMLKAYPE